MERLKRQRGITVRLDNKRRRDQERKRNAEEGRRKETKEAKQGATNLRWVIT